MSFAYAWLTSLHQLFWCMLVCSGTHVCALLKLINLSVFRDPLCFNLIKIQKLWHGHFWIRDSSTSCINFVIRKNIFPIFSEVCELSEHLASWQSCILEYAGYCWRIWMLEANPFGHKKSLKSLLYIYLLNSILIIIKTNWISEFTLQILDAWYQTHKALYLWVMSFSFN
jgi:hypothetical protein